MGIENQIPEQKKHSPVKKIIITLAILIIVFVVGIATWIYIEMVYLPSQQPQYPDHRACSDDEDCRMYCTISDEESAELDSKRAECDQYTELMERLECRGKYTIQESVRACYESSCRCDIFVTQ